MARGDIVRHGPDFLAIWSTTGTRRAWAFPVVVHSRGRTRVDLPVPDADRAALGLPVSAAWMISLRQRCIAADRMRRIGKAPPAILDAIVKQLRQASESERIERQSRTWP